jgi:putative DNA primase/helicase
VWLFKKNPDDAAQRLMFPGKLNLAPDQTGLSYTLEEANQGVAAVACGGAVNRSADAVLEPEPSEARSERSERQEAMEWLREQLSGGPVPQKQIRKDALAEGLAWRTVRRAKQAQGCRAEKDSFRGGWSWRLPLRGASLVEAAEDVHETPKMATPKTRTTSAQLDTFEEGES